MKSLIRFSREDVTSFLEVTQYLDNLVKALELSKVKVTSNLLDKSQIAHFVSPTEEKQINDAYLEDMFVVISVGYAEGDVKHKFFNYGEEITPVLTNVSRKLLKQADLILVPTTTVKDYLIKNGIEVRIEIVTPGVDVTKYTKPLPQEKTLFNRYFYRNDSRKFVITHGTKEEICLNAITKIANDLPNIDFYYLINENSLSSSIANSKHLIKNIPSNLKITHIIPDDIFVSGMKNALCYLSLPTVSGDYLNILEAFAAKTPVIYMDENKKHGIFKNRENVLIAATEEKAERLIWDLSKGKEKTTINNAYDLLTNHSLEIMGQEIVNLYQTLTK